jgi:hypothetical protein
MSPHWRSHVLPDFGRFSITSSPELDWDFGASAGCPGLCGLYGVCAGAAAQLWRCSRGLPFGQAASVKLTVVRSCSRRGANPGVSKAKPLRGRLRRALDTPENLCSGRARQLDRTDPSTEAPVLAHSRGRH